ncbi:MAG: YesU family protein [Butyrivibrio sp.]|nr:YesU family protein [Butyrivibrio sp.]
MAKAIYENMTAAEQGTDAPEILFGKGMSFPSDILIEWEFMPMTGGGAFEMFFGVKDTPEGESAYGISFLKRDTDKDRAFNLCRLMKYPMGAELERAADPLPTEPSDVWYSMKIHKKGGKIAFYIDDLLVLQYDDEGGEHGDILTGGAIIPRLSDGMRAGYRNIRVTWI